MPTRRRLRIAMTSYYLPSEDKIGAGWMAHRLANELSDRGHAVTMVSPATRPVGRALRAPPDRASGPAPRRPVGLAAGPARPRPSSTCSTATATTTSSAAARCPRTSARLHGSCFDEALHATGAEARVRMFALGLTELVSAVRVPRGRRSLGERDPLVPVAEARDPERRRPRELPRRRRAGAGADDPVRRHLPPAQARRAAAEGVPRVRATARAERQALDGVQRCAAGAGRGGARSDQRRGARRRATGGPGSSASRARYEGFGVPYIEAMASGTPVVASPNLGAREILEDGRLGVLGRGCGARSEPRAAARRRRAAERASPTRRAGR